MTPGLARTRGVVAAVLLLPVLVAGCSSQQERYCSALEEEQQTLAELGEGGFEESGTVGRTTDVFERLAQEAPEDLRDEWDALTGAWLGLERALRAADADESMFEAGERPEGMSAEDYDRISQAAVQLRSTRVVEAASGIEQHAQDVCGVDLTGSGPAG
ncbi:MAG TPA: hypothetical protein VFV40_09785 [Nocardioides sp.]|nr:hypothetical protein [Nocardioides sp.]